LSSWPLQPCRRPLSAPVVAGIRSPLLKRQNAQRLGQIAAQLTAINTELLALGAADPELKERLAILTSIPGVGQASAPGAAGRDARARLAWTASGRKPRRPCSGGATQANSKQALRPRRPCAGLRQALYMPALVATRSDRKAKYQALIGVGKPPKLAITTVMRKLLLLASALPRDRRTCMQELA
jgi:transposase